MIRLHGFRLGGPRPPMAKRRFNLLREEGAGGTARRRGSPRADRHAANLGPLLVLAALPLAGFWQIQSDLDPALSVPSALARQEASTSTTGRYARVAPIPEARLRPTLQDGGALPGADGRSATARAKAGVPGVGQGDLPSPGHAPRGGSPTRIEALAGPGTRPASSAVRLAAVSPGTGSSIGTVVHAPGSATASTPTGGVRPGRTDGDLGHPVTSPGSDLRPAMHAHRPHRSSARRLSTTRSLPRTGGTAGVGAANAKTVKALPAEVEIFYRKARAYEESGNVEDAARFYRQVLALNPRHRKALARLASIYMDRGEYASAHPLLADLLALSPRDPEVLVNLAIDEIALDRPAEALRRLAAAEALDGAPRFEIFFHRGVALARLGRPAEAIESYRAAEVIDPARSLLLFNMALTYDRMGRYREALVYYGRFLHDADTAPSAGDRRAVESRIGVLMAWLAAQAKADRIGPRPDGGTGATRGAVHIVNPGPAESVPAGKAARRAAAARKGKD